MSEIHRVTKKASTVVFSIGVGLCLACVLPSHWASKLSLIAFSGGLFYTSKRLDDVLDGDDGDAPIASTSTATSAQKKTVKQPVDSPYYDWNNIADEAVGFLICGNSGSAKSSLATWLAGHLTSTTPMAVIALDPHYNDCWELAGITAIGNIEKIEAVITWLICELDRRCELKGQKQPLGDPLLVITDELNAALERFENPKTIESAMRRLGSEGRKFGLTFIGINQSSNASALGIDAKFRSNYALILLGQSARTHPQFKNILADVAYPCVLDGSISPSVATHPTHGDYQTFKKVGNAPQNLKPINQLPLPHGLLTFIDSPKDQNLAIDSPSTLVNPSIDSPSQSNLSIRQSGLSTPLAKLLEFAQAKGCVSAAAVKSGVRLFRDTSTSEIRRYFEWLENHGYGITTGDPDNLEFSANN
jgi:hypothetical protein